MELALKPVFVQLRGVLEAHRPKFAVSDDTTARFGLEAPIGPATLAAWGGKAKAPTMPVAWVEVKKNYVSYHLMGLYMNPLLEAQLSEPLRARMQGKSCFNFTQVDEDLFKELAKVTSKSLAALKKGKFITA